MITLNLLKYLSRFVHKNIPGIFFPVPRPVAKCILAGLCMVGAIMLQPVYGQDTTKQKKEKTGKMRDTLDGKIDLSHYIINLKGIIPIPYIITEPALGDFGVVLAGLLITPKKTKTKGYVPPDMTAAMAMYTANKSWMVGGLRTGSFPNAGLKYRVGLAYANIFLTYYRTTANSGEKQYDVEMEVLPFMLSLSKKINKTDVYLGMQYTFANMKVKPQFKGNLPAFIQDKDLNNNLAELGVFMDRDKRNTVFTPDKGTRLNVTFTASDNWTGSDYEYQRLNTTFNWFIPIKKKWISGLRAEVLQVFNEPPFYAYPSVNMRGIPYARFQGSTVALVETEQRFDFAGRWSVVGFGGVGRTMFKDDKFGEPETVYNVGTGFRYLLARAFGLRTGIDIAKGPDSWGWYIVFGHNWNR